MTLRNKAMQKIEQESKRSESLPKFRSGDTVRVHYLILEGEKERTQIFQGVVIRRHRGGLGETFTVRKVSYGIGVERTFPYHSPRLQKVEVKSKGRVHQSRLFYLRDLRGKAARIQER